VLEEIEEIDKSTTNSLIVQKEDKWNQIKAV
jgi:hypothetical protein